MVFQDKDIALSIMDELCAVRLPVKLSAWPTTDGGTAYSIYSKVSKFSDAQVVNAIASKYGFTAWIGYDEDGIAALKLELEFKK